MAINDHPDVRCANQWRHELTRPPAAVALVIGDRMESNGEWWPCCQACLDEYVADPDPLPHDVAYLVPTRQRGAGTVDDILADLDHYGYAIVDRTDPDGTADPLPT